MTFQRTLFTKREMCNAERPVKGFTRSSKSTASFKYAYHETGHHTFYGKSTMHDIHQMVILTHTKPIASGLSMHDISVEITQ